VPRSSPVEDNDLYVVLVSGLRVGSAQNDTMALQLLADYIGGRAGGERGLSVASRIVRVVVAGELLCVPETSKRKYGKENSSERLGADGGLTNYKQVRWYSLSSLCVYRKHVCLSSTCCCPTYSRPAPSTSW
jgi:hypothetical protein